MTVEPPPTAVDRPGADPTTVQGRVLRVLFGSQVLGGVGVSIGMSVGALLAAEVVGVGASGLAQSAAVVGAALLAVPVVRLMRRYGRRPGLVVAYLTATLGGVAVVAAVLLSSVPLLFVGLFLFGGGTTANNQARFTAVDLAPADRRARHLSLIMWATTLGVVAGPNLAPLAGRSLVGAGVPTLAGPFLFSAVLFGAAALVVLARLRPDPLQLANRLRAAREPAPESGSAPVPGGRARGGTGDPAGMRAAAVAVAAVPAARLGLAAMAVGHLVMIAVMAMTPVHILGAGHSEADTLRIVGLVISVHVVGMFAFSPVTGWLADRYGRRPVILGGVGVLLAACAVAGTAGHDPVRLTVGLFLLGLGWSGTMVAGSTLLSESVPERSRPSAQGLADLTVGLAGAAAGAVSGLVLSWSGFPTLTLLAAIATVPLTALALRPVRERLYG